MPTVSTSELPIPKSWDEFEDIVWDIYSRIWKDPNAQRNGRAGQRQHGVDIYGQPVHLDGRYAGIQCKRYTDGNLSERKIETEIAEAEKFRPPLAEYTIATTEHRDATLQQAVREINAEREAEGKFSVRVVFWEDLWSRLAHPDNRDLLQKVTTQPTAFTRPALPPPQATSSSSNMPNTQSGSILIVTIAKVEAQSVLETFSQAVGKKWARQVIGDKIYYDLGVHGGASVFMVQSEMGTATPAGALLTVRQAIQDLRPQAVIMCGIAFGLRPDKQKLGDILVAKQLGCYEPQKVDLQKGQMLRGDRTTASECLLRRFRSGEIDWEGASIHFGLVLSGEKLVNDPAFRDRLLNTEPEAIGGEMEGAGLYAAAREAKVDWILVKAICDWADGTKNDDAQPLAARNAAQFTLHVLQLGSWGGTEQSLRKYYGEWPQIFAESPSESLKLIRIVTERDELKLELATAQEHRIQERWETLRAEANAGYKEAIRVEVAALVEEMESIAENTPISPELQGRVYRLAASTFLPNRPGGDAEQCRAYLMKARGFSSGDTLIQCQIIEASLTYQTRGLEVALAMVDDIESEEVDRFCFSLYLESDDLDACAVLLQKLDGAQLLGTKDWVRLLALYYAAVGERVKLEDMLTRLTTGVSHADHYVVAGLALTRIAYRKFQQFCEAHNVCPAFHLELDLDELIDSDARRRASEMFAKAYELYQRKGCPSEALQALLSAVRLEMDVPESELCGRLLAQLQEIAPQHPLLQLGKDSSILTAQASSVEQLKDLLDDPSVDVTFTLPLAANIVQDESLASQVIDLLQRYQVRFGVNDVIFVQFLSTVFRLRMRGRSKSETIAWLTAMRPPECYMHVRPLLHFLFFVEHDPVQACAWLEKALLEHPEHPEVLAVATTFFRAQGNHKRELEYATRLFGILRTSQTAARLLDSLMAAQRYEEFLRVANGVDDLPLCEESLQVGRAYAWIRLGRPFQAQEHLKWLRDHDEAKVEDLLNLARIYQCLGRPAKAFAVLHDCLRRYPNEPAGYLELSQAYLDAGQRDDSFRWALEARNRFPEDPDVAAHFFFISHPAGFELRPEVGSAFREFVPGGRFESTGHFEPYPLEEAIRIFKAHREHSERLETLYHQGKMSSMMLCYGQHSPLFRFHFVSAHLRLPRYAAAGDQPYDATWLKEHNPQEVVLDYTAILTLWSLYEDNWLDVLRQDFRQVWISAKLLQALLWEQRQIAHRGQLARHRARIAVRDIVNQQPLRFHIHPRIDSPDSWDLTGTHTEATIAIRHSLPYLNEYRAENETPLTPIVGLQTVANVLARNGEIDLEVHRRLALNTHPSTPEEQALADHLSRGSDLVVETLTLVEIALADALGAFCNYFGEIHLSQPAWQRLQGKIVDFKYNEEMAQELRRLRSMLGQAIQNGFVRTESLSPDLHQFPGKQVTETDSIPEDSYSGDEIAQLLLSYMDDLLGIAHFRELPIWADDRWISKLYPSDRKPPFIFGTDAFLEWKRGRDSNDDECFVKYGRLIEWGYLGLPLNPHYVLWLLNQGLQPDAGLFAEALSLYRQYPLDVWKASQANNGISPEFGTRLLSLYNQATISTMLRSFEKGVSTETCAALVRSLDLTRYASQTEGREPFYFASLLLNAVMRNWPDQPDAVEDFAYQATEFIHWLDEVLQASGVAPEVIQEAWHGLLQQPIAMYEAAIEKQARDVAFLFAQRLFDTAPDHARAYLLNSDLGAKLRQAFGLNVQTFVVFKHTGPEGTVRIIVPEETWAQDLRLATIRYLTDEPLAPITVGTVTIRADWLAPGSIFLRLNKVPSEIYKRHSDARGRQSWICILPAATEANAEERLGFWRQGLRKLESLGLPTNDWLGLREAVESTSPTESMEAGRRMQCYLLGQLAVARDYFAEAAQLGPEVIKHLLTYIEPEIVREWLDMPRLDWENSDDLITWAETKADSLLSSVGNSSYACNLLVDSYAHFGYSIFPDSRVWQQMVWQTLEDCEDEELRIILEGLLTLGETSVSLPLKANVLLSLLGVGPVDGHPDSKSEIVKRVEKQIARVVLAWGWSNRGEATYTVLEQALCDYLYTTWRNQTLSDQHSSRELVYLAYVGSGYIADALARCSSLQQESIERLVSDWHTLAYQRSMTSNTAIQQPVGLIKPRWGQHLNYALAYLIGAARLDDLSLGEFAIGLATRHALLEAGLGHRSIQAYMQNLDVERDWLDSLLVADIGWGVADILVSSSAGDVESWSEEEKRRLSACAIPEAGIAAIAERLNSLPLANEQEVLQVIGMSFLAAPSWDEKAYQIVQALIHPTPLEQIKRFPMAYGELVWRLIELLTTNQVLPADLKNQAKEIAFGVPVGLDNTGDLIETQATVLSRVAGFSQCIGETQTWLRTLATDERIALPNARRGVKPFVELCPSYPDDVQQAIGAVLIEMATGPRFSHLWELKRIRREIASGYQ